MLSFTLSYTVCRNMNPFCIFTDLILLFHTLNSVCCCFTYNCCSYLISTSYEAVSLSYVFPPDMLKYKRAVEHSSLLEPYYCAVTGNSSGRSTRLKGKTNIYIRRPTPSPKETHFWCLQNVGVRFT